MELSVIMAMNVFKVRLRYLTPIILAKYLK
jgi:hypothetical protein